MEEPLGDTDPIEASCVKLRTMYLALPFAASEEGAVLMGGAICLLTAEADRVGAGVGY